MKKVAAILFIFVFLFFSFGMQFLVSEARVTEAVGCCVISTCAGRCGYNPAVILVCQTNGESCPTTGCTPQASEQDCLRSAENDYLVACNGKEFGDDCSIRQPSWGGDNLHCLSTGSCGDTTEGLTNCCTANAGCFEVTEQACRDNYDGTSYTTNAECQQKCKFPTPPPGGGTVILD